MAFASAMRLRGRRSAFWGNNFTSKCGCFKLPRSRFVPSKSKYALFILWSTAGFPFPYYVKYYFMALNGHVNAVTLWNRFSNLLKMRRQGNMGSLKTVKRYLCCLSFASCSPVSSRTLQFLLSGLHDQIR